MRFFKKHSLLSPNLLAFYLIIVFFSTNVFAESKVIAVFDVQVIDKANEYISPEQIQHLSKTIHSQAIHLLDSLKEKISDTYTINSYSEGCIESGCLPELLTQLNVNFGIQPTIRYALGKLRISIDLANQRTLIANRNLSIIPKDESLQNLQEEFKIGTKEIIHELVKNHNWKSTNFATASPIKSDTDGFKFRAKWTFGMSTFNELFIGARLGASYNEYGFYLGYGPMPAFFQLLFLIQDGSWTFIPPVFVLTYKSGLNEYNLQMERGNSDINLDYSTYSFLYSRIIKVKEKEGFFVGAGILRFTTENYYTSETKIYPWVFLGVFKNIK